MGVHVQFVLGPAGSGKTYRCLEEIRAELKAGPEGKPLLFLAPKQATFQIERQLLADPSVPGYTRLQVLSFDRLAQFVVDQFAGLSPDLLSEEGRLMVLRSLLTRHQKELKVFHSTARLPGFAQQLGGMLKELQEHRLSPDKLLALAEKPFTLPRLADKLHDFALLLRAYVAWLQDHQLEDGNRLLEVATELLKQIAPTTAGRGKALPAFFGGVWLDGFAELTPQELDMLSVVAACAEKVTLAFCLEGEPRDDLSWLSTWSVSSQTYRQCRHCLGWVPKEQVAVALLQRTPQASRFAAAPELAYLETHWHEANPEPCAEPGAPAAVRIAACANPEAEATLAAREILRFVRQGGRFREAAVLVRNLAAYAQPLRRAFARYHIPCFLDRRESVTHHPLAELTRAALRMGAFGWKIEDWFGALKAGFTPADEIHIDELENQALARGWEGFKRWTEPFPPDERDRSLEMLEELRQRLTPPFARFISALAVGAGGQAYAPTGPQLASALRELWTDMKVGETLAQWSQDSYASHLAAMHSSVWQQMQAWLDNVEMAFPDTAMPLRDWLPVVETGLGNLTVGVVPPALDQVLVGAVDRSRNPDLRLMLVLGMNELVFPSPPAATCLLNEAERALLENHKIFLGLNLRQRLARERFLGYIACTRSRERLLLTYAAAGMDGKPLNPSPFIAHLRRLFPKVAVENFSASERWEESEHACELTRFLLDNANPLAQWAGCAHDSPRFGRLADWHRELAPLRDYAPQALLSAASASRLYGKNLQTSVSHIEQFAMCPFRFFVEAGMRAEERKLFEVDPKELGSFQHQVLEEFHHALRRQGRRWREVSPPEAKQLVAQLAAAVAQEFSGGLFATGAENQFTRRILSEALQTCVGTLIEWMAQYQFDPVEVELGFGLGSEGLPPWELDLGDGHRLSFRGVIDRVDIAPGPRPGEYYCVVLDYKSSQRQLDPLLLEHGIQMQLPAYLAALRQSPAARQRLGAAKLIPAGVFYINVRGEYGHPKTREDALLDPESVRRKAYRHTGRFDLAVLRKLDSRDETAGDQFSYRLKADGTLYKSCREPLPSEEFLQMLDSVEANLVRMGRSIFAGRVEIDPYRKANDTPCLKCVYKPVCRIDPWSHVYRELKATAKNGGGDE